MVAKILRRINLASQALRYGKITSGAGGFDAHTAHKFIDEVVKRINYK